MKRNVKLPLITLLALVLCLSVGVAGQGKSVAWLGVYTQTVDPDMTEAFDLPVDYGAVVNEVVEDSPADDAGIREDDIIVALDGTRVTDARELTDLVQDRAPGDEVVVTVMRGGRKKEISVTLDRRRSLDRKAWVSRKHGPGGHGYSYLFTAGTGSYIGVSLIELSDQLGEYFGVSEDEGVLVSEVHEDSPAMKAGLKAGDVIIALDRKEVYDAADVQKIIRKKDEGEKVNVAVLRNKKKMEIAVEVGEREDLDPWVLGEPDLSRLDLRLPKLKGLYKGKDLDFDRYYDAEEFEEEIEQLREELLELKKELRHLKKSLN